jgi:thiamine-phosphate pyrophosphorylase
MNATATTIRGLYVIADAALLRERDLPGAVTQAVAGGAALVQYRDKDADVSARETRARAVAALCNRCGVPLIINDDVALAAAVGAAGVHLGRDDPSLCQARRVLGPRAIIGVSCYNDLAMAIAAQSQGADYVAFGAFFPSPTKPEAVHAPLSLLTAAKARLRLPVVAIGGITPDNAGALIAAGADAVAVIHGVFGQADPRAAAQRYARLFRARSAVS